MILALDWGLKYTGVAVGERALSPQLLPAIYAPARVTLLREITNIARQYSVKTILIGLPSHRANKNKVIALKKLLEADGYQVVLRGEDATSKLARELLLRQGLSAKEISQKIHSASAGILLREYLGID